ncbi:unnamed protein product, partial [Mesorhabditis belari]|uniref:Protein kinase domain-containing protein n=1 Tax=Mesorhabditis belari TaxID=2138241 RepID=A0AAF3J9J5_9BILA
MASPNPSGERYIGQGAYGKVYELIGHEPPAVIKYMHCGNEAQLEFFKKECEALKQIYHENLVRLYRYTEEGIKVGIVMEYCQRGTLKEVILDPTITYSMNTVLTWGIQLFDAIDHMYQKHQMVHRDIKPEKIFVTNEYQLKIGDFGLEADVSCSHRNDVYSLGLVMWEIVERRVVFSQCTNFRRFRRPTAGDALELLRRIATKDPFISTLSFLPKKDKQQKSLIRPIGFNGEIDEIVVAYHQEGKEIFQPSDPTLTNNKRIRAIAKLEEFDRSKTIGRAGYGRTVYLVTKNEKQTIIKSIECQSFSTRKNRQKEYEILAMLRHKNVIAHLKTWALSEKEIGIEMEYCDRGTLQEVVSNLKIVYSMGQVIVWGRGLFGALHYIYSKHRVVHRDIKLENIFVNKTFDPKLGDFGTAREVDETLNNGTPDSGTPRYMNPDINNLSKASHRNDVYSMGLVLWEIIERSTVFMEYGKKFERDRFITDIALLKLTELIAPESPQPIQEIVKKCTVFNYRKRPLAKEIVEQLKQLDESGFFPTMIEEDEQTSELIRPIGFNGGGERVPVSKKTTEDHPDPSIQSTTHRHNFTTNESERSARGD